MSTDEPLRAMDRRCVVAVGGNALILEGQQGTIAEQLDNARAAARQIGALAAAGWGLVVTHGNGPQVGFILLRSEMVRGGPFVPALSLDMAGADSQGGVGYIVTSSLSNELARRGLVDRVACVLTRTVVDPADPAFARPSKPIGGRFSTEQAELHRARDGWTMVEDAGRGYRRVVASPRPVRIVEAAAIRALVDAGLVVVAAGGGGIPVVEEAPGVYGGVEAVIDKDLASGLLASSLGVPVLVICTGVERVAVRFRQPDEQLLERATVAEMRRHLTAGEFPEGSMGPKVRAAVEFIERGGQEVVITSLGCLEAAVAGRTGTRIVRD